MNPAQDGGTTEGVNTKEKRAPNYRSASVDSETGEKWACADATSASSFEVVGRYRPHHGSFPDRAATEASFKTAASAGSDNLGPKREPRIAVSSFNTMLESSLEHENLHSGHEGQVA